MFDDEEFTDEQKSSFDRLAQAIADYHHAFGDPGLIMDWVLVVHLTDPQVDGTDAHRTALLGPDGQPGYRRLGLLEYAATVEKRHIADALDGI